MREIALDTETTGLATEDGHRIVEIGCVEMVNRVRTGEIFHAYINPERSMPEEAFKIHGISNEFLQDKPLFKDVVNDFKSFISNAPLVIHNAGFDMKFINAEFVALGEPMLPMEQAIDTLRMARKKYPGAPASLDALCRRFNIDLSAREKHGALLDAELLAEVYLELTGGSQSSMSLDANKKEESPSQKPIILTPVEPREFSATEEEKAAHKAFIDQYVKNPIWQ